MSAFEKFREVEERYDTESIKYDGIQLWAYFRIYYFDKYFSKLSKWEKSLSPSTLEVFKALTWGRFNLKTYKNIVITSSDQRKMIDGELTDRLDLINGFSDNSLFVEFPSPQQTSKGLIKSKNAYSKYWWYLFEIIYQKLSFRNLNFKYNSLSEIQEELEVNVDDEYLVKRFLAQYSVTKWFLKKHKIKTMFITSAYTNMARVLAAKHLKINVIEMQHGLISAQHVGYNTIANADNRLLPNQVWVYGKNDRLLLSEGNLVTKEKIKVIGQFYIDYLKRKPLKSIFQDAHQKQFFCFTAQDVEIENTIEYLNFIQESFPEALIVFLHRKNSIDEMYKRGLNPNIKAKEDIDTYIYLKNCDIHFTIYSTCALESIALGTPSILFDFNGLASNQFKEVEKNSKFLRIVQSKELLISSITELIEADKKEAANSADFYFNSNNFVDNINKAFNSL